MRNWKRKLNEVRVSLDKVFADDTAAIGSKRDIPSSGHCAVVAMLVRDLFGGDYVSTVIDGQSHWYNKLYTGNKLRWTHMWVDLTGDQFGGPKIIYSYDSPLYQNTRVRLPEELNSETKERFYVLRDRFNKIYELDVEAELAEILQEEIWKEITAATGETQEDLDEKIIAQIMALTKPKE